MNMLSLLPGCPLNLKIIFQQNFKIKVFKVVWNCLIKIFIIMTKKSYRLIQEHLTLFNTVNRNL